jgi:hypothetical protein
MTEMFEHVSCAIQDEEVSSAADFIGIQDIGYLDDPKPDDYRIKYVNIITQLKDVTVPTWFSGYATAATNDTGAGYITNESFQDTSSLYDSRNPFLTPNGEMSGGMRF